MRTKRDLIESRSFRFLKHFVVYSEILRRSRYRTKSDYVDGLARRLSKDECHFISEHADDDPKRAADMFLKKCRPKESTVRTRFNQFLQSEVIDDITQEPLFSEFPVAGNRTDVNHVNGTSHTYELKSPRDNDSRLSSQLETYQTVFEFVSVVVPRGASFDGLSDGVGKITYDFPEFDFQIETEPKLTKGLSSTNQLECLRQSELTQLVSTDVPADMSRGSLIDLAQKQLSGEYINRQFKQCLRERYS